MEKSGIFDRNNYSKKTLDTFEILAAYFIDIYYNHLYIEAKKLRTNKSANSITEGYKHALNAYMQGIENPKLYKQTLLGIHGFFESSGFGTITFSECIERITVEFIPKDYYSSVTKTQKTSLLKRVLCQSSKNFIIKLVKRFLPLIIDNHNDEDNVRILQDEFIDVIILERENVYHLFIEAQTKSAKKDNSGAIIDSLRKEIKKLYTEKFEVKKQNALVKKLVLKKEKELNFVKSGFIELQKENQALQDENMEIMGRNTQLLHRLAELEHALHHRGVYIDSNTTPINNFSILEERSHELDDEGEENGEELREERDIEVNNTEEDNNKDEYVEDIGKKVNKEIRTAIKQIENKKIAPEIEQSDLFYSGNDIIQNDEINAETNEEIKRGD